MKKSNKREYLNMMVDNPNEKNENNDSGDFEHVKKFVNLKKRKTDNEINKLSIFFNDNINIENNENIENNMDIEKNMDIKNNIVNHKQIELDIEQIDNNLSNNNDYKNKIKYIDELKLIIIFNNCFNYDSLILLTNHLVKKYGENNIIEEKITNDEFQKIIWKHIGYILYPSFLFDPYILDSDYKNNYIVQRTKSLNEICPETQCLFPTWKKIYNYDIDYNFDDLYLHNKKICKNLIKKIFEFYEMIYKVHFNIIFGEIFSFILNDYQIILNPLDPNFNINIFNQWSDSFNLVINSVKNFISNIAKSFQIEKIDELDKHELIKLLNKIKEDFIDNFDTISKNDIKKIFEPLEKFHNIEKNIDINWEIFSSNSLKNINYEITLLFKYKQCINILSKNKWIHKFVY
jgi:hypothetical protein